MAQEPTADLSGYIRETAEGPAPAAPAAAPRMLTEGEAYAVAASEVQRETASLKTEVETLKSEKAELENKLDLETAAKSAAEQAREKAEKDLADYKAEQELKAEQASRSESRVAKVREVASHLKDDFFTPERAARWAAMEDPEFDAYVAELAEVSPKGDTTPKGDGEVPRETAAAGRQVTEKKGSTDNLRALFPGMSKGA
jgi:hypothetical protein